MTGPMGFNIYIHGDWLSVLRMCSMNALSGMTKLSWEAQDHFLCLGASNHVTAVLANGSDSSHMLLKPTSAFCHSEPVKRRG